MARRRHSRTRGHLAVAAAGSSRRARWALRPVDWVPEHEACRHRRCRGARRRRCHRTCAAGGRRFARHTAWTRLRACRQQPARVPLELVALEHDRDDSRLVVRGIVRNPASAVTLNGLHSGCAGILERWRIHRQRTDAGGCYGALVPGAEAPFVVTLPDADSVDRYRVSFRTDDRIVPHIDRRGRNAIARTE